MNWLQLCETILTPTPCIYIKAFGGSEIWIKRDDLTHQEISGNKWRKLKYNLKHFLAGNYEGIISFGGAFSNHVFSLSSLCYFMNIPLVVIVRGEEVNIQNSTLSVLNKRGQIIEKVSRYEYKQKKQSKKIEDILALYSSFYVIPEGGTNDLALEGMSEVMDELMGQINSFDYLVCSAGTGGTAAGFLRALTPSQKLLVYPALKGEWMATEIKKIDKNNQYTDNLIVRNQFHFGGYGKGISEMYDYIDKVKKQYDIPLDPIYTSKAFYGLMQDFDSGYFPNGSRIIFYHSGGLQGLNVKK